MVDLAAYRIVQEALTNAHRYGDGSARLDISYTSGDIEVEVSNGMPGALTNGPGSGYGLLGMRERATAAGGSVTACCRHARVPVPRCCRRTRSCASRRGRHDDPGAAGRRPGAGPRRLPGDHRLGAGIEVVGEAADGREAVDARPHRTRRRRAHGHPHARHGRPRGDPPASAPTTTSPGVRVLILTTFEIDDNVFRRCGAAPAGSSVRTSRPPTCSHAMRVVAPASRCSPPGPPARLDQPLPDEPSDRRRPSGRTWTC